ncbi:hypothetical protein SS50377_20851 [Spironucleus salmonicida]|uniref:Uncharacterized protein n=1 Tax=Spironucleus salmonicida TaxID=348837 RepID=V6LRX0_9EUKA|nr:hypothetical protein SS50377_20851 [Spironucleus salmonicida]|eukprot:EST43529.1 Hypothetical protein SS50377_16564 [Spironucleus salmonicida]
MQPTVRKTLEAAPPSMPPNLSAMYIQRCKNQKIRPNFTAQKILQKAPKITKIDFSQDIIGARGLIVLCDILSEFKRILNQITEIDLSGNALDNSAIIKLSQLLENQQQMTYVNLSENNFGRESIQSIKQLLLNNKKIQILIHDCRCLKDEQKQYLSKFGRVVY